jgi:hypothetical protein
MRTLQVVESLAPSYGGPAVACLAMCQELVERGRQAASKFTWEAHGAAVAEAYRSVTRRWV